MHWTGRRKKEAWGDVSWVFLYMGLCLQARKDLSLSKLVSVFAFGDTRIKNSGFGFSCMCLASQRTQSLLLGTRVSTVADLDLTCNLPTATVFCKVTFCGHSRSNYHIIAT